MRKHMFLPLNSRRRHDTHDPNDFVSRRREDERFYEDREDDLCTVFTSVQNGIVEVGERGGRETYSFQAVRI